MRARDPAGPGTHRRVAGRRSLRRRARPRRPAPLAHPLLEDPNVTVTIRGGVELPSFREDIELTTADGLTLVGELALPETADPIATLVFLHPLSTHGGFMD